MTFLFFRAIHNSGGGLMTQNQLEIVMLLHDRGVSHIKIAEMLEVSTTTVKRACARIENERTLTSEQYPICKECGKRIVYERKTRPRLFCCRKCAQAWWNKRRYTSGRASDVARICPICGKKFIVNNSSPQKYCSKECHHKGRIVKNTH